MARPPVLLRKFTGLSVRIVAMKGPSGLSEMIQNFTKFGFEAITFFPVGFGPSSPSNSDFDWRNIARIDLFACSNSRAFRYCASAGVHHKSDIKKGQS
jgi:hypothetical protein